MSARSFSIRIANPTDSDAVSAVLAASYSELLTACYDSDLLAQALPHFTKANPTLLDSKRFAEMRDQDGLSLGVITNGNRYLSVSVRQTARFTTVNFEPPHRRSSLSTREAAEHQRWESCSET
jgi:hypothetical protein